MTSPGGFGCYVVFGRLDEFLLQQQPTGCGSVLCFYHLIKLSMAFVSGR